MMRVTHVYAGGFFIADCASVRSTVLDDGAHAWLVVTASGEKVLVAGGKAKLTYGGDLITFLGEEVSEVRWG